MAIHSAIDTEEDVTVYDILLEVVLQENCLRDIFDVNSNPSRGREFAAEIEIFEVNRGISSIGSVVVTVRYYRVPMDFDHDDVCNRGGSRTVVGAPVAAKSTSYPP